MTSTESILLFSLLLPLFQFVVVLSIKRKYMEFILPFAYLVYLLLPVFNKMPLPIIDDINLLYLIVPSLILSMMIKKVRNKTLHNSVIIILCVINSVLIVLPVAALVVYLKTSL